MSGSPRRLYHYTDLDGYNAIRSQQVWQFTAFQPPGNHPFGAYFTTLPPATPKLAKRLGLPRSKIEYVFEFDDAGELTPLPGARGAFIFYSPHDYEVISSRQRTVGPV